MSKILMTLQEAYAAMYIFQDPFCQMTKSNNANGLFGSMSHLVDGKPADEAIIEDWGAACEKVKAGKFAIYLRSA